MKTVSEDASLASLVELASDSVQNLFPVVDRSGTLAGELSIDDVRRSLVAGADRNQVTARDLMHPAVGPLVPQDDLATAARLLAERQTDAVTVVRSRESGEVLGTFSRRDLIVAYGKKMKRLREEGEKEFPAEADLP